MSETFPQRLPTPEDPQKHGKISNYISFGGLIIAAVTCYFTFFRDHTDTIQQQTVQSGNVYGKYPFTATRYINSDDLKGISKWERDIMRNEIYARYGYVFQKNPNMVAYFNSQIWYTSLQKKTTNERYVFNTLMNDFERSNIQFIQNYDK